MYFFSLKNQIKSRCYVRKFIDLFLFLSLYGFFIIILNIEKTLIKKMDCPINPQLRSPHTCNDNCIKRQRLKIQERKIKKER